MSVWDTIQGASKDTQKYTHWPNPFKGMVKRIDVLACEEIWQAKVAMWGIAYANWFFSSFIPSPVELTRKFVGGSYKCGFYIAPGIPSPLNVIWRDGKAAEVLLEASSPFTKGLFYWWAAETAWSAMSTYSSVIHKQEQCELTGRETQLANGIATFPSGSGEREGEVGLYTVMRDVFDRYSEAGGHVYVDVQSNVGATGVGYFVSTGSVLSDCQVAIRYGNNPVVTQDVDGADPFQAVAFSLNEVRNGYQGTVSIWFRCHVEGLSILPPYVHVPRFTVTVDPLDKFPASWSRSPDPPPLLCQKLYDSLYPTGVG